MTSVIPQNPTAQSVSALLPKLHDPDSDFRYMSLNDLFNTLSVGHQGFLQNDFNICARTVDGLLKTLDDQNGEVQNLAIKCLGPLVLKVPAEILPPLIEKLSNLTTHNSVDTSITATALRTVVTSFPRPVPGLPPSKACQDAYSAISKVLIPRLVGYVVIPHGLKGHPSPPRGMLETDPDKGVDSDAIDVLTEVARCFGPMLQDVEVRALQRALTEILENNKAGSVVKKKTVVAISALAAYFSDGLLSAFVSELIQSFRGAHLTLPKRRLLVTTAGSLARSIPQKFGPYLKMMAPFVLSALSEQELDEAMEDMADAGEPDPQVEELREAALVALEGFLASCSHDMRPYTQDSIDAALRYVKYDPNVTDEDDEEMGGTQGVDDDEVEDHEFDEEDEDFEEEDATSDDDDVSWKVRRCAAKVLSTIISTRGSGDLLEDGTLYLKIAPVLVSRFNEREENVRLEILATLGSLVRKTGEILDVSTTTFIENSDHSVSSVPQSRKRRRGGSDASMFDTQAAVSLSTGFTSPVTPPSPTSGPRADLAKLSPVLLDGITKLLKGSSSHTKQAVVSLLNDVVKVQHGGIWEYLNNIVGPLIDAIGTAATHVSGATAVLSGAVGSATGSSLRTESLALVSTIVETHASSVLLPYFDRLVPSVVSAVHDKYYKVSSEALGAGEQLVKAVTPPRSPFVDEKHQALLGKLYQAILDRVTANDADLEVRQRAIHALGVLLARTSGSEGAKLIASPERLAALDILQDRLNNETTRLSAVRAIDTVAALASDKKDFKPVWVRTVSLELGAQLRKADRTLRGSSLGALKNLTVNPAGNANLDDTTMLALVDLLIPILNTNDLHLLGLALVILSKLVQGNPKKVVNGELNKALCTVVLAPLGGAVLDAFLILLRFIGQYGVGKHLMQGLLKDVGVAGDPAVVGKAIGNLLVSGGSSVGVGIDDFVAELGAAQDDQRKCLALSVLGEAGLRMGESSSLQPSLFMSHFKSKSDRVPLAAAVALGRAGAGKVGKFLPVILAAMNDGSNSQYLLLHSIKEILQSAGNTHASVTRHSQQLWDKLLAASQTEDNRAVGAECLGRLAMVDPKTYLPLLRDYLQNPSASVRGMVIQAMRYTFADSDETFDYVLKPVLIATLTTMLNDPDLENRRLALTALNSATHNKPEIILPHLHQLLPLVMKESVVRPELVREVPMGPFKHKVDDGLEVRKSAYETLYALLENAFSRVNIVDFFDRVIAGLGDEHDIRVLCNLMLTKLIILNPEETVRRLDAIAERFRTILAFKPKENAVKQDIEKAQEASKGVLRVSVQLNNAFPAAVGPAASGQHQTWKSYWEWIKKDYNTQIHSIEQEVRAQNI